MYRKCVDISNILLLIIFQAIISCNGDDKVPTSKLQSIGVTINGEAISMTKHQRVNDDNDDDIDDDDDHGDVTTNDQYNGLTLFQFIRSPEPGAYESGYRRGNEAHLIERNDKKVGNRGEVKVHWTDRDVGQGRQNWKFGINPKEKEEMKKMIKIIKSFTGSSRESN